MKTTHANFNLWLRGVPVLLAFILALSTSSTFAQSHDTAARAGLQSLTFARHVDTPFTLGTATTALTNASTVVGKCDKKVDLTQDVACQVTMAVSGSSIPTFGTTGDGGDIADADALISCCGGLADVLVVTAISKCGGSGAPPGFSIIGCGAVGGHGIVSVNALAGNQLGVEITHEFLHNQGRGHRGDAGEAPMTPGAILNPILTLTSNIINGVECLNLHTGATFTAADNGPIVDPPPVISCPAPVAAECTTKSPSGAPSSPGITAFLAAATATSPDAFGGLCEPTPTLANNAPSFFSKGTTSVTFTATNVDFLGTSSQCQANIRVVDTTPPSITCPAPIAVECKQSGGTSVSDPAITTFLAGSSATDICDASPTLSNNASALFPLGTTGVIFKATDADLNVGQCSANVVIKDSTPPVITAVSATPNVLWPPNHQFVPVALTASVTDTCDVNPICKVTSVVSSEPPLGGGSGNTQPDYVITGASNVLLRAERNGTGPGRTYSVAFQCTDKSGNSSQKTTVVTVPHNR
jgi:hypothetical protein